MWGKMGHSMLGGALSKWASGGNSPSKSLAAQKCRIYPFYGVAATGAEAGQASGDHTVKKSECCQETILADRELLGTGLMLPPLLENQGLSSDICRSQF